MKSSYDRETKREQHASYQSGGALIVALIIIAGVIGSSFFAYKVFHPKLTIPFPKTEVSIIPPSTPPIDNRIDEEEGQETKASEKKPIRAENLIKCLGADRKFSYITKEVCDVTRKYWTAKLGSFPSDPEEVIKCLGADGKYSNTPRKTCEDTNNFWAAHSSSGTGTSSSLRSETAAPTYLSAEIGTVDATTVAVTFSEAVTAASSDYSSGVSIKVNSVAATISSGTRQTDQSVVYYVLSSAVAYGDTITWEYVKASGHIVDGAGIALENVTAQSVTNNVKFTAFWNFEETNGSAATDETGKGTTLADHGAITRISGKTGNAAHFVTTSSQYFSVASNSYVNFGDEDWYGIVMVKLNTATGSHVIMSKYLDTGNQRSYLLWTQSSKIEFRVYGNGAATPTGAAQTPTLKTGVWYMIYFWHDSANDQLGIKVNLQTPTTTSYSSGTYSSTAEFEIGADLASNFLDGDLNWAGVGRGLLTDAELQRIYNHGTTAKFPFSGLETESLPIWDYELTRYSGNPVISTADTGTGGNTAADPFLLVLNEKLYIFFESTVPGDLKGQEWMAESTDGYTWTNFQKISANDDVHYGHPQAFVVEDTVHLYMQSAGVIKHKTSPVSGFPSWSAEDTAFDPATYGWGTVNETAIIQHTDGNWYLFANTDSDKYVRVAWSSTLPSDWNTATDMGVQIDYSSYPWLNVDAMVEITPLQTGGRLLLYMGTRRQIDTKLAIGVFEITSLSTSGVTGAWLAEDFTFGLNTVTGWDDTLEHRMSPAYFNGQWIVAYDAEKPAASRIWEIGIATR